MASTKRKTDMHWDRPVAHVWRRPDGDIVMWQGENLVLNRETRRQEAAAVSAARAGSESATVWGIAVRNWVNATDHQSNNSPTERVSASDRKAAEDRKANEDRMVSALQGDRESGRIKGWRDAMRASKVWRAALRAERAEVRAASKKCDRRDGGADDAGVWGTVAESAATLRLMGIWRIAQGEWSRQGSPEARSAERANSVEPVTVRAANGSVRVYIPDVSVSPVTANVTRRMARAAERGTAEAAERLAAERVRNRARSLVVKARAAERARAKRAEIAARKA